MFPPLFCVAAADETVSVFQSQQIRPRAYVISPYTIFHGSTGAAVPHDAYILSGRFGGRLIDPPLVCLLTATTDTGPRGIIYSGLWQHTGKTVFSMYCNTALPVLEFPETTTVDFHWATTNKLPVIAGTRGIIRVWARRWNPSSWLYDIYKELTPRASSPRIPKSVETALLRDAEQQKKLCPITLEPIQATTATITPCFHIFNSIALSSWTTEHHTCPECRAHIPTETAT